MDHPAMNITGMEQHSEDVGYHADDSNSSSSSGSSSRTFPAYSNPFDNPTVDPFADPVSDHPISHPTSPRTNAFADAPSLFSNQALPRLPISPSAPSPSPSPSRSTGSVLTLGNWNDSATAVGSPPPVWPAWSGLSPNVDAAFDLRDEFPDLIEEWFGGPVVGRDEEPGHVARVVDALLGDGEMDVFGDSEGEMEEDGDGETGSSSESGVDDALSLCRLPPLPLPPLPSSPLPSPLPISSPPAHSPNFEMVDIPLSSSSQSQVGNELHYQPPCYDHDSAPGADLGRRGGKAGRCACFGGDGRCSVM